MAGPDNDRAILFKMLNGVCGQFSKSCRWASPIFPAQVRLGEPGAPVDSLRAAQMV
jgi:hypothetical protein